MGCTRTFHPYVVVLYFQGVYLRGDIWKWSEALPSTMQTDSATRVDAALRHCRFSCISQCCRMDWEMRRFLEYYSLPTSQ